MNTNTNTNISTIMNGNIVEIYDNQISDTDNLKFEDLKIQLDSSITNRKELYDEEYYGNTHYKWLNEDYTHFGYKYTPNSINIDTLKFNPNNSCSAGGLYFTNNKNFLQWKNYGTHLHEVKIYSNTPVYKEFCRRKAKAPAFYLGREISQNSCEYFDLVCDSDKYFMKRQMNNILDFSGKNPFNILEKNISITNCVYSCIRPTMFVKEKHIDTLQMIKDIYVPEIKDKYIIQVSKPIQTTVKFEEFLETNINSKFIDVLKDTGSIISGSSVIKFMLNEDYLIDDIDIYCNQASTELLINSIKVTPEEQLNMRTINVSEYNMTGIISVLNIKNRNLKIQLIVLEDDIKPEDFIKTNFDFDFCKCTYDGDEFHVLESLTIGEKIGKISDEYMNRCFRDKDAYSTYRIAKTAERIIKYIKRGYLIVNTDIFFDNVLNYAK